jgi:uncharacterized membrane protein
VSATIAPFRRRKLHPLNAILLAFPLPLFLGALLSDLAYARLFHVQWANFSSWLIAGGLFVGGFALLWALVDLVRSRPPRRRHAAVFFVVLLAMWGLGLVNAFVHGKDAYAIMPEALWLSAIVALLALVATWIGHAGDTSGESF